MRAIDADALKEDLTRFYDNEVTARKLIDEQPTIQPDNNSENPNGSDVISRQAAIDALRYAQHRFTVADEAGGMGTVKWSEYVIYFAAAERVLSDLPSAQPEIIRCRNCKFASGDSRICMKFGHSPIGELDFCSFAERREVTT